MRSFQKLILLLSVLCMSSAFGEGLPVPWPFPWAINCPTDWASMNGKYSLSDTTNIGLLEIDVTPIAGIGIQLINLSLYAPNGALQMAGVKIFGQNERVILVDLVPISPNGSTVQAVIKMHFASSQPQCTSTNLVPILTLESQQPGRFNESQYKLIPVGVTRVAELPNF